MMTAIRNPDYIESGETCDYHDDPYDSNTRCGEQPAGYIGDIYYACREHTDAMCDWLEED